MKKLDKTVKRESSDDIFEKGSKFVIVTLEPPNLIGFRLKKTRSKYYLTAGTGYILALKAHINAQKKSKGKK